MDATIRRIVEEVAKEFNLESGFLMRIIELEESKAHLARRHGIFDELRDLSRKAAQRELENKRVGASNEN
jgi:hypothetical protein